MEVLWTEPADLQKRDLFDGPGGPDLVPRPGTEFELKGRDNAGHSRGYDVRDPSGRSWDVKIGDEARSEIVVSRVLWAIGFHQPRTYYVPDWKMTGGEVSQPPGRFRLASDHKTIGQWSWKHNPFWGTRPFHALVVANLVLNNWDFKTSNNRIYETERGRHYVVQDVGAALGKSRWPVGTRDNIEHFESQDLIEKTKDGRVEFDFHARHRFLVKDIPPRDVVWACRLLSRLTDRQWDDAFRGAGYPEDLRRRYIRKIKEKIAQGIALETAPAAAEGRAGSPTRRGDSGERAPSRAIGG